MSSTMLVFGNTKRTETEKCFVGIPSGGESLFFTSEVPALFIYCRIVLEMELIGCAKILPQLEGMEVRKLLNTGPVILYCFSLHWEATNTFEPQNDIIDWNITQP